MTNYEKNYLYLTSSKDETYFDVSDFLKELGIDTNNSLVTGNECYEKIKEIFKNYHLKNNFDDTNIFIESIESALYHNYKPVALVTEYNHTFYFKWLSKECFDEARKCVQDCLNFSHIEYLD